MLFLHAFREGEEDIWNFPLDEKGVRAIYSLQQLGYLQATLEVTDNSGETFPIEKWLEIACS